MAEIWHCWQIKMAGILTKRIWQPYWCSRLCKSWNSPTFTNSWLGTWRLCGQIMKTLEITPPRNCKNNLFLLIISKSRPPFRRPWRKYFVQGPLAFLRILFHLAELACGTTFWNLKHSPCLHVHSHKRACLRDSWNYPKRTDQP